MRLFTLSVLICGLGLPGATLAEQLVFPVPGTTATMSDGFFDPEYARDEGDQHLGQDIAAPELTEVVSPVDGVVILNRTDTPDPDQAYLVIRSDATGYEHVLAHIRSSLATSSLVDAGDPVGTIVDAGTAPHLHYGINKLSVAGAIGVRPGWGFGKAPIDAVIDEALAAGWLDPAPFLKTATSGKSPVSTDKWDAGLVAGVSVGWMPCGETRTSPDCLRNLGFGAKAIEFSKEIDGDYSGATVGISFMELGDVDLAMAEFLGADVYSLPVLVNGAAGLFLIENSFELRDFFRDEASLAMLRRYPGAFTDAKEIRSHRVLPDGTQRFTLVETVVDSCRACDILGAAVTFLEVGPSTGGVVVRKPVGLLIGDPKDDVDMSAEIIQQRPESLQVALNVLGYDAGMMDGYPGPQTRQALMEYQADHCLTPTGQPDRNTAQSLVAADGFGSVCAGAKLPDGISANTPLKSGIYVDDPGLCALAEVPFEAVYWRQIMINGPFTTWGVEGGCETKRTDIVKGVTQFKGLCSAENQTFENKWRFNVLSSESFVYLDASSATGQTVPQTFYRCNDQSLLSRTWFPDQN